jgi:2-isopropylmalate synthase
VANAIAALEAGVNRVHACGLGVGERVGNTSMDQLLLNLKLLGWFDHDLSRLVEYVELVSKATRVPIPVNYPLSGGDAFRTATGVHASAIIKAMTKGDGWLADRVYSGVPAGEFGREQVIEVGHMSGMSNVRYWLEKRSLPVTEAVCAAVLKKAKACAWTLTEKEILAEVKAAGPRPSKARASTPTTRKRAARGRQKSARS